MAIATSCHLFDLFDGHLVLTRSEWHFSGRSRTVGVLAFPFGIGRPGLVAPSKFFHLLGLLGLYEAAFLGEDRVEDLRRLLLFQDLHLVLGSVGVITRVFTVM